MKMSFTVFLLSAMILFNAKSWAEEPALKLAPTQKRVPASYADPVDPVYEEPAMASASYPTRHVKNKAGYDGGRVQFYYDPLSGYSKFETNNASFPSQFGYRTTSGNMGGVQALWSVWAPSDFEFQTGL